MHWKPGKLRNRAENTPLQSDVVTLTLSAELSSSGLEADRSIWAQVNLRFDDLVVQGKIPSNLGLEYHPDQYRQKQT